MSATTETPPTTDFQPPPICPACDYILTGLPAPRCPECGTVFDWADVARQASNPPRIAFERMGGVHKLFGLLLTWLTVLFAPWKFAGQAVRRISPAHAAIFGGLCFACTPASLLFGADVAFVVAWVLTGPVYVGVQALVLSLADWPHRGEWRRSLLFWLAVGGYTSAIVPTEVYRGPPPLELSELYRYLTNQPTGWFPGLSASGLQWCQIVVWLLALGCCFTQRLRARRVRATVAALAGVLVMTALLVLFSAAVEHIGERLYNAIDSLPF